MTPLLHPQLINDRFGDPGLFVQCLYERWALLFDLGDLAPLAPRKLLRVRDVFVSHTHVDHFIGFDRLLRTLIGRDRTVRLFGPAGFIDRVAHRLAAYSWNLADRFEADLAFIVTEIAAPDAGHMATFRLGTGFRREAVCPVGLTDGVLREADGFRVRCALLEHRIPCLGFAVEESCHVNVWKNRLDVRGLATGPWLRALKQAVRDGQPDDTPIVVRWRDGIADRPPTLPLGSLRRDILDVVPGQKIGYIVDTVWAPDNIARVVDLVRGADILFIEAAFARDDAIRAADRAHLTTAQAGEIARRAGVARVEPFHFSPRYAGEGERLQREVAAAFAGETVS